MCVVIEITRDGRSKKASPFNKLEEDDDERWCKERHGWLPYAVAGEENSRLGEKVKEITKTIFQFSASKV